MKLVTGVCKGCGEKKLVSHTSRLCKSCSWNFGEIWVLHMTENINDEWEWKLIDSK